MVQIQTSEQSTALNLRSLEGKGVNSVALDTWKMHNKLCRKTRRKGPTWRNTRGWLYNVEMDLLHFKLYMSAYALSGWTFNNSTIF